MLRVGPVSRLVGRVPDSEGLCTRQPSSTRDSPAFRQIVAGFTINEFGNWIGDVALAILVFDRTGSALATACAVPCAALSAGAAGSALTSRVEAVRAA